MKGKFEQTHTANGEVELALDLADARTVNEPGDAILMTAFKTLIEQTTDYIYIKNRNHVILAASRTLPSLSDAAKNRTDLVGTTDYDNHPEEAADGYYRLEEKAFAEGQRVDQIQQVRAQDGTTRWIDNRKYPLNGPDGEIIGIFGVAPDITSAIETREKLAESEEWLRDAQEIAGLSSYVLDIPKKKWIVSPGLATLLGIGDDYDRGFEQIWPLIHPDDRPAMAERLRDTLPASAIPSTASIASCAIPMGRCAGCIPAAGWSAMPKGKPLSLRGTVQDITERKQADAALRENRDLMRVFIEHAPVALAMLDREMRYLAVSPRWRRIHDLQDRELIGHSHYEFFTEVSDEWKAQHRRALAGEAIPSGEVNMARADGSLQWLRREIQPWFTADGAVGGIIIFSEDVTRRRQAEEELRRHKELLQLFVEHAPVALAMFDLDMRYIAVSKLWAQDHSIDLEKIIGRSHYEVNPDVPERWKETHRRGLAGETQSVEEDRYDRADGSIEWIRWQIMPWRTAEGSAGGIVMFYEDITERKMAEAAVRESKELLQLFIDRAPAALAMFDREMRYLAVSRRWLEEYSLVGQNVLGRSHYEIVPDIPERWKEAHRRGLAGETLKSEEDRFQRADGTVQWIEWEVVPWRAADGSVGGIVLFADDITARKQAEERLRLAASVFTGAREGITITDLKGTILDVNDAFTRITGYKREEARGAKSALVEVGPAKQGILRQDVGLDPADRPLVGRDLEPIEERRYFCRNTDD